MSYPARVRESYAQDLLDSLDVEAIRGARFRIVVDYGYSAASFVLPLVVGPLGVEAVSAHGFIAESAASARRWREAIGQTKRLVAAIGADLGVVFDRRGAAVPRRRTGPGDAGRPGAAALPSPAGRAGRRGKAAFPVTVTSQVEELAGDGLEIVRTPPRSPS